MIKDFVKQSIKHIDLIKGSKQKIDYLVSNFQGKELLDKMIDLENKYIDIEQEKIFINNN